MRFVGNDGSVPNYESDSFRGSKENLKFKELPLKISGNADSYNQPITNDDFVQPGNLYWLLPVNKQERLIKNMSNSLKTVSKNIQKRMVKHIRRADANWGSKIAEILGL